MVRESNPEMSGDTDTRNPEMNDDEDTRNPAMIYEVIAQGG